MIPGLLLMAALVMDVGNWYTHKRQIQNRADAAAFAAGVAYGKNWKACVQNTDPAAQARCRRAIANTATAVCGRPRSGGLRPSLPAGTLPRYNANIANQSKLDVVINSTDYTNNTDDSDGGNPPDTASRAARPDRPTSPAGGLWTDVKVKERDLPSLFGGIGLPLSQNGARARIEIHPAISGTRFLPLAIPNNTITKVQIRYFDECRDPARSVLVQNLKPLPDADQTA